MGPHRISKRRKATLKYMGPSRPVAFSCEREAFSLPARPVSSSQFWQQLENNHRSPTISMQNQALPHCLFPRFPTTVNQPPKVCTHLREQLGMLSEESCTLSADHPRCFPAHTFQCAPRPLPVSFSPSWKLLASVYQQETILESLQSP